MIKAKIIVDRRRTNPSNSVCMRVLETIGSSSCPNERSRLEPRVGFVARMVRKISDVRRSVVLGQAEAERNIA